MLIKNACIYYPILVFVLFQQVGKEKDTADAEERKVAKINEEVSKKQQDCERDLEKAEPALQAAIQALNTLNKVWCCDSLIYYV